MIIKWMLTLAIVAFAGYKVRYWLAQCWVKTIKPCLIQTDEKAQQMVQEKEEQKKEYANPPRDEHHSEEYDQH